MNGLGPVAVNGQADVRLFRANCIARMVCQFLRHAFTRQMQGERLGCICSVLKGKQVVVQFLFRHDLGSRVQHHHKASRLPRVLNRPGHHVHEKQRSILTAMLVGALPALCRRGFINALEHPFCVSVNVRHGHRQKFGLRITIGLDRRLVDFQKLLAGPVKHPHGRRR